ncbi:MAG TPA: hypothetical protein VN157_15390 [Caulobacter sp.]|nr:hypothetical protein [Caulobacter sp.]
MPAVIRAALAAAIAVLAAAPVHAQRLEVDPTRSSNYIPTAIPTRPGELISSELSVIDAASGVERSAEWFVFTGRAGEVITAQVRSDIPTLEVSFRSTRKPLKVLVEGPATDAPLRLVLPKDDAYVIVVHSVGPQRFGKYLLSLGVGDTAPLFDPPPRVEIAKATAPAAPVAPITPSTPAPAARSTTPTPFESPKAWGMFGEIAKRGGLVPSSSKASFALASTVNGSPFISRIYKVAADGLLYKLEFNIADAGDVRAWRGETTPEGSVLWTPLHGFHDRGRTVRDDLLGNIQRTRTFNQDGSTWGPWDNQIFLFRNLLSEEGILAVQQQLDEWEARFDATIAEIERQGIATDGADDARWARQRALRESNARTSNALNALGSALSGAQAEASASERRSNGALQATLEEARRRQSAESARQAGQAAPTHVPPSQEPATREIAGAATAGSGSAGLAGRSGQPSSAPNRPASGQPLRFMLELGLRNPINGVNGVCFSSVITVAGPAGWPIEGESTRAAMVLVEPYRAKMRQACAEKAALQDSAPANIIWNSRGRETAPEESVARWRAMKQLEVGLP